MLRSRLLAGVLYDFTHLRHVPSATFPRRGKTLLSFFWGSKKKKKKKKKCEEFRNSFQTRWKFICMLIITEITVKQDKGLNLRAGAGREYLQFRSFKRSGAESFQTWLYLPNKEEKKTRKGKNSIKETSIFKEELHQW